MQGRITGVDVARMVACYEAVHGRVNGPGHLLRDALVRGAPVTSRHDFPVHVTCGAVVVRPDGLVLQIHHRNLRRWLFPGGHLEPDDRSFSDAALRELLEETGIDAAGPGAALLDPLPVSIDLHAIPANPRKDEPRHFHADLLYAFSVSGTDAIRLQLDEVTDARWAALDQTDKPHVAERLVSHVATLAEREP